MLIFRHSDWSGTEIIILRLHIKRIFCQAWFQFYLPCNHAGFKEKPTGRAARSCAKRIVQLMLPKWHGHLALNQKQNWLVSGAYLQTHSDWSGTEIIILRLHIKCIFCQAWFRFCPPCNHVGFKEKPTERVARSCAKRIKNKAPLPSDKTCYVAWTSNAQSEPELALSGAYLQTFRLERHRNHHLETSYQVHLLSSLVSILPALQPCWVQGKTHRACCPVMCQKNCATHATQAIKNNAQLPSDKTCYVAWTSSSQSEAELACIWCLSSDTFRLERHRNHHLETSYQVHLLSRLVSILPALQPCWVQGKTYRACCPVMCQKNRATHATQAIKNNAQLPSDKTCYVAWTSNAQSEPELALSGAYLQTHSDWSGTEIIILRLHIKCIFCQAWFQFYLPCNHAGFKEKPTGRAARSCAKRIVQLMLPKPSKITHNFHLTRRAMWHGHLALNQKQNWLVSGAYLQTHSDWSGTEIIILRLHIKCIFCQAWFRFCPPCNHVGFKEKPTERVARSCAKRIKNKAPLPSDKTCYVAWTSNAQSEAELACIWCLSSDIQTGAAQKSSSWDFISSASSVKLGFDSTCLATMLDSRKNQQGVLPGPCAKRIVQLMLPKPSKINAQLPFDKTCYVAWTSRAQSEAEMHMFRHSDWSGTENHYLETSYQAHLLSSLVSILPALRPCWVQGKTYRACCPVMCQKNRATHATQAIKNNAQLPSDKTCCGMDI